jgi:hypothetical protein
VVHARVCVSLAHSMTGMRKARVRGPCVVTGRLTGAPYSVSVTALEAPEVRRPPPGALGPQGGHRGLPRRRVAVRRRAILMRPKGQRPLSHIARRRCELAGAIHFFC